MWKVGQSIVAIADNSYQGMIAVVKGNIYIIKQIWTCKCGRIGFDIGVEYTGYHQVGVKCSQCHNRSLDGIWWQPSTLFKPAAYSSAIKDLCMVKIITETSDQPMKNPSPMKPLRKLILNEKEN